MNKSFTVIQTEHKDRVWAVPEDLMLKLELTENDAVTLQCGSAAIRCRVGALPAGRSRIGLSAGILKALHIPDKTSLLVKQVKPADKKTFRLGPVIGVLTFHSHIIGRKLGYYRISAMMSIKSGLFYVFSGRNINVEKNTISGYYYDHAENEWRPGDFPFPDVVIDRCYPNVDDYHTLLEQVIGPARIFNKKSCINKADFAKVLGANHVLGKYHPETLLFQESSELKGFLQNYREVFLKPVNSMKGKGIVTVKRAPKGLLTCRYMHGGKITTRQLSSADKIFDVLKTAAGRERPYILQQAIQRMEYRHKPFSFRTWAMKNGQGRWVMPGMFAKGASGEGFLTNFTAGAQLIPLKDLYDNIIPRLPFTQSQLQRLLEDLTLGTAVILDKNFGPLGELGLDIVFDLRGKPWLIEANGNPGKIPIFMQTEYPEWGIQVYQYPLAYAAYLAGFGRAAGTVKRRPFPLD